MPTGTSRQNALRSRFWRRVHHVAFEVSLPFKKKPAMRLLTLYSPKPDGWGHKSCPLCRVQIDVSKSQKPH